MELNLQVNEMDVQGAKKSLGDLFGKIIFIIIASLAFTLGLPMILLLEWTGRFKEINLSSSGPKQRSRGRVIVPNHPDGNDWFFLYRCYFNPIQLIAPWLVLKYFPCAMVDTDNFYENHIIRLFRPRLIRVDRKSASGTSRTASLKRATDLLKKGDSIVSFFEGTRTSKATTLLISKNGKRLGKLSESLGTMIKFGNALVQPCWFEYKGASFLSLRPDGHFDLIRFLVWYWRTLRGKNGRIILVQGELLDISHFLSREEIVQKVEDYLLSLADTV